MYICYLHYIFPKYNYACSKKNILILYNICIFYNGATTLYPQ